MEQFFRWGPGREIRFWFPIVVTSIWGVMGCQNLPRDDGQIWSCFGLVTEDVVGGTQTDTNLYFGGCSPADP